MEEQATSIQADFTFNVFCNWEGSWLFNAVRKYLSHPSLPPPPLLDNYSQAEPSTQNPNKIKYLFVRFRAECFCLLFLTGWQLPSLYVGRIKQPKETPIQTVHMKACFSYQLQVFMIFKTTLKYIFSIKST